MQILTLDLLFIADFDPVEHSQLWHVKETQKSVELDILNRIHTQVHFRQQRQLLNILELIDFLDVVQTQV